MQRLIILSLLVLGLSGCVSSSITVGRIAAHDAIRTIQAQKERAEACQREEEDLLKPSISAISEDRADEIVEAYLDLIADNPDQFDPIAPPEDVQVCSHYIHCQRTADCDSGCC